jgi:predicted nucleic acid-binding protein
MIECKFFDTNILLYAHFEDDASKHNAAEELIEAETRDVCAHINTQVINEYTNNAVKKGKETLAEVEISVDKMLRSFEVHSLTPKVCIDGFHIAQVYHFSFWDSLIVAAALDTNCVILYTEDLQNGQVIDNRLTVRNPFLSKG